MIEPEGRNFATSALHDVLTEKAAEVYGPGASVEHLTKLSAGASRESWSFDICAPDGATHPLILKRDPVVYGSDGEASFEEGHLGVTRETEGKIMELAGRAGVPSPEVPFYLAKGERSAAGFIMRRVDGETLGRRILREDEYSEARAKLAFQCGEAAARLHGVAPGKLPELESKTALEELNHYRDLMHDLGHPYPGFEYGFRWLEERLELAGDRHTLVHGDFRLGNLIVDRDGLRGVLDYELTHIGNPLSDLGWICVRSWRYGQIDKPVGGFGEIGDLLAGYKAGGGGQVSPESVFYWEVFGTLRWGMLCIAMGFQHINAPHALMEKAAIGRRSAETENDLLMLIDDGEP
jgi:aminoglycoside phosphotransferase (APT) family kinase protein